MGKTKEKPQLLFKNSNNTFNTHSKTCSAFSVAVTKSIIMQLSKKIQNNNYYDDKGKIKRDLSVETDICILRRYVKENKSKIQNKNSSLARFKYSIYNDKNIIEESNADTSGCGDSQPRIKNAQIRVDLTTLVVDNLKSLLNEWIKNYLLENDKTKHKIETVLDSLLHKVELEKTSSSGTYTLDVEVINETTNSISSNKHQKVRIRSKSDRKLSSQTVPLPGQRVKLISTLSVPKISSKYMKNKSNRTYVKYRKSSINKLLSPSTSCNILEIKTESFTKRCATYQNLQWEKNGSQQQFTFLQQPTPTISSIKSSEKIECSDLNKRCVQKESVKMEVFEDKPKLPTSPIVQTNTIVYCNKDNSVNDRRRKKITKRHQKTFSTIQSIKGKSFSYHCKKLSQRTRKTDLLKHIQDVFKYFEKCNYVKDLRFDIQINISPNSLNKGESSSLENATKEIKTEENNNFNCKNIQTQSIDIENKSSDLVKSSRYKLKIISLLDGAISQTRYLTSEINNMEQIKTHIKNQETGTSGLDIYQDITEIKNIVKNLVNVADHRTKEQKNNYYNKNTSTEINTPYSSTSKIFKNSVAIQCVTAEKKNVLTSGLKLEKEPNKKETQEFNPRLTKRSTSYRIIDSESVLQIHDLSCHPKKVEERKAENLSKTETLTKSQSLLAVPQPTPNRKFLAFYCDKCINSRQYLYNTCNHNIPYANMYPICGCDHFINDRKMTLEQCPNINFCDDETKRSHCCGMSRKPCLDAEANVENFDSTTDIDETCDKKILITKRNIGFKEGCFYCFLLWIPIVVIMWIFYMYILKGYIETKKSPNKPSYMAPPVAPPVNASAFFVSMTDLGF